MQEVRQLPRTAQPKQLCGQLPSREVRGGERRELCDPVEQSSGALSSLAAAVAHVVLVAKVHAEVVAVVWQASLRQGLTEGHADQCQATCSPLFLEARGALGTQAPDLRLVGSQLRPKPLKAAAAAASASVAISGGTRSVTSSKYASK